MSSPLSSVEKLFSRLSNSSSAGPARVPDLARHDRHDLLRGRRFVLFAGGAPELAAADALEQRIEGVRVMSGPASITSRTC
jgi:hypothetical protein